MGWTRLDNPKPAKATDLPPDGIRISARQAGGRNGKSRVPWIRVQIGKNAARRGSFHATTHKVCIMLGKDEERGNVAVVCDDQLGTFVAKKQTDGSYTVAIGAAAADGNFSTGFASFSVGDAKAIGSGKGPAFITFPVPEEFLGA